MEDIPDIHGRGERARLFPVLADSSKEGRTLSIFLAVLSQVPEFGFGLLNALGQRSGKRTKIETYTEITFPQLKGENLRPDGLMVVKTGRRTWSAFIEAKIANANLKKDQIESYLKLAKDMSVDAVITISNEFAPMPEHHPVDVDKRLLKKKNLYHLSWFSLLTLINILKLNDKVEDEDHEYLLTELERFLVHQSAGLKRYDTMGQEWTEILNRLRSGTSLSKSSAEVLGVVASWHSEMRDLCLLLSRRTGATANLKIAPRLRTDPRARIQQEAETLVKEAVLSGLIEVPDTASPISVEADLSTRTIRVSMKLDAPRDKSQQKSRLNWLLRQLRDPDGQDVIIITNWPGRAPQTSSTLQEAIHDPDLHSHSDRALLPTSFIVMKMMTDGRKFSGRKTFIEGLENLVVEEFYGEIAQRLTAWQPPAPKLRVSEDEADPDMAGDQADSE